MGAGGLLDVNTGAMHEPTRPHYGTIDEVIGTNVVGAPIKRRVPTLNGRVLDPATGNSASAPTSSIPAMNGLTPVDGFTNPAGTMIIKPRTK